MFVGGSQGLAGALEGYWLRVRASNLTASDFIRVLGFRVEGWGLIGFRQGARLSQHKFKKAYAIVI